MMNIAILYQNSEVPVVDGIRKPMKPGGYRDGGADIGYCLKQNKNADINIITPVENPDVKNDLDWVFPDTKEGIETAIKLGADTLWLNTVIYKGHPIENFKGVYVIGQKPSDASLYDDKFYTNGVLQSYKLPVAESKIALTAEDFPEHFPCIIKPIRGRGSQGVIKCNSKEDFTNSFNSLVAKEVYGTKFIAEEFLCGKEITVTVMPDGKSLPAVERFNQKDGIAPYNGDVPVTENSRVIPDDENIISIRKSCEQAFGLLGLKALIRVDCRADKSGKYKIFDFNLKPNMTGASRPHRQNLDSLTMIAAREVGMSYADLLTKMAMSRWMLK